MEGIWVTVVVLGLLASALAQLTAAALCFSVSPGKGLVSLVVPGYLFVGIRQHQYYRPVIGLWVVGLLAITAGTIALT
jgi:tetrahydromethanopterin S-methyltransferase subunit B